MARPGFTKHRKFVRLARLLGCAPLALGCLEFMWDVCYENGDPYLGDVLDVESAAQWGGDSGALCAALLACGGEGKAGFIEELADRPGHFQCHDFFDHAPRYVGKRLQREMERKLKGTTLSEIRSEAGRKGAESKRAANGQQADVHLLGGEANGQQVDATPAPAPAPAPAPSTSSLRSEDGAQLPAAPAAPRLLEEPAVFELPCRGVGAKPYGVTQRQVDAWAQAYPGVDVLQELRKAKAWLEAVPTRGKTRQGMARFLVGWLGRAQDSAAARPPARAAPSGPRGIAADQAFQSQLGSISWPTLKPTGSTT